MLKNVKKVRKIEQATNNFNIRSKKTFINNKKTCHICQVIVKYLCLRNQKLEKGMAFC